MIRIKLSTSFPEWPLQRQTPSQSSQWGDCLFLINQEVPECDYWVVIDNVPKKEMTLCPPSNTIFFIVEPPTINVYRKSFLSQFSTIISPQRDDLAHPHVIHTQQGLPWHIGRRVKNEINLGFKLNYDELKSLAPLEKTHCISVICSNQTRTEGHRRRIEFVQRLQEHFGSRLHRFGRGINDIEDKWDAIARYKYHIVIENSSFAHYWTEKLSDAYLGWAFPFYYGCPNLGEYFSQESFLRIDLNDFDRSVSVIENAITAERYEQSQQPLNDARMLILDSYNIFPVISKMCRSIRHDQSKQPIVINSSYAFEPKPRVWQRIRDKISRSLGH